MPHESPDTPLKKADVSNPDMSAKTGQPAQSAATQSAQENAGNDAQPVTTQAGQDTGATTTDKAITKDGAPATSVQHKHPASTEASPLPPENSSSFGIFGGIVLIVLIAAAAVLLWKKFAKTSDRKYSMGNATRKIYSENDRKALELIKSLAQVIERF